MESKSTNVPAPIKTAPVKGGGGNTATELPTDTHTDTTVPTVKGSGRAGSKGGSTTKAPTYEANSLAALESAYQSLNNELKNTVVSDERLAEINREKAALEEQIKQLKIRNGLLVEKEEKPKEVKPEAKEGSLAYV